MRAMAIFRRTLAVLMWRFWTSKSVTAPQWLMRLCASLRSERSAQLLDLSPSALMRTSYVTVLCEA